MRIVSIAAMAATFIAGICILSSAASARGMGPKAAMIGADPVYGSTRCTAERCVTKGAARKTCSGYAALCTKVFPGSPKCASALATCLQTGIYRGGPTGQVFYGMSRE